MGLVTVALELSEGVEVVRLPQIVALPDGVSEVAILCDGARRIIVPVHALWDDFFAAPGIDLGERDQPVLE
jgi:antitoxin VapB